MPAFLSRLVERTFGLVPVTQPVTHSIFAPERPVKSDYMQDFAHVNESVDNPNSTNFDGSRKTKSVRQNNSGTQEQIESVPLLQTSKRIIDIHTPPTERTQNNEPLHTTDSDTLESVESELLPVKNRNDRISLRLIPKSILYEEQSHDGKQDSQGYLEPFVDNINSLSGKTLMDRISDSSLSSGSSSNLKSGESLGESLMQNSDPNSSPDIGPTSRANFFSPSYTHPDSRSSPVIPGKQNLKRLIVPKVNATLEQTGNMLIEQYAVVSKPPSNVPIIKVTIGRIEVKAVKPPQELQPQIPPQRQRPVLSLDDYLKQYNG